MNNTFGTIATFKKIDAIAQIVVFVIAVIAAFVSRYSLWTLMIMAPLQILSCLLWTIYFMNNESLRHNGGRNIRRAFWIVMLNLAIASAIPNYATLMLFMMILIGPICGFIYFFTTCREYEYYRNARKPYYFL